MLQNPTKYIEYCQQEPSLVSALLPAAPGGQIDKNRDKNPLWADSPSWALFLPSFLLLQILFSLRLCRRPNSLLPATFISTAQPRNQKSPFKRSISSVSPERGECKVRKGTTKNLLRHLLIPAFKAALTVSAGGSREEIKERDRIISRRVCEREMFCL